MTGSENFFQKKPTLFLHLPVTVSPHLDCSSRPINAICRRKQAIKAADANLHRTSSQGRRDNVLEQQFRGRRSGFEATQINHILEKRIYIFCCSTIQCVYTMMDKPWDNSTSKKDMRLMWITEGHATCCGASRETDRRTDRQAAGEGERQTKGRDEHESYSES